MSENEKGEEAGRVLATESFRRTLEYIDNGKSYGNTQALLNTYEAALTRLDEQCARLDKAEAEAERMRRELGPQEVRDEFMRAIDEHAAIRARNAELEKAIEGAPHGGNCAGFPPRLIGGKWDTTACDCWKSRALEEGK